MPVSRRAFEIAAVLIAAAVLGFMLWRLSSAQDMTLSTGQPVFGDFIAFWSAGRATLDGHLELIHDRAFLYAQQQAVAPDVRFVAPWNSPPTFLFFACALALLPYPVAAIAFFVATAALFLWVMSRFLPDARALLFPVTSPVTIYQAGTVQAGLLLAAISGLALHWLDKRPRAAGALVALLAIKPHLAVLWPLLLALSGRWRVFWAAALATAAFVGVSMLVFGVDAYVRFFDNLAASGQLISEQRITTPAYASLYANLLGLGAPQTLALGTHYASAAVAVLLACLMFRRGDARIAGAALCAATLLVSPYLFFYDFTLLLVGVAMLGAPRNRLELAAAVLAWGAALSVPIGHYASVPVCPAAAWLVLIASWRRARQSARVSRAY